MERPTDVFAYNAEAWARYVDRGNEWTQPVTPEAVAAARQGEVSIVLTPTRPIPADWLGELPGRDVLCLAGSGGQQAPILAAAGANVTVFDACAAQLGQDRLVAEREGLDLELVQGDMRDLSALADQRFDLIVHPVSNCFVPDIAPVWREAFRVLRPGGELLSGVTNPVAYLLDPVAEERGEVRLIYRAPYSDLELTDAELARYLDEGEAVEFGHTLEQQIGGQLAAGFHLVGFFEDHAGDEGDALRKHLDAFIATRARRPA